MTVVVWDGMNLATDRQANDGSLKWESSKAWYVTSNGEVSIVSGVGLLSHIVTLREWYKNGALPDRYPAEIQHNTAQLIVIRQDGLWVYDGTAYPEHKGFNVCAFGHGRDFAFGALAMGADARKAVEIACEYSLQCGKGVEIYSLQRGKDNVEEV